MGAFFLLRRIFYCYSGEFDGNKKTVSGLFYNQNGCYVGLFGYVDNGIIRSIGLIDSYISGAQFVGGIVGTATIIY